MTIEERARPARPSIAELRRVTQPPEIRGRPGAEHWTAGLYLRRVSPYLTRLLLRTPVSANAVTMMMIVAGVSAGAALLIPGIAGAGLALLLGQLQMLLDCSDGEVARWRRQQSALGVFLDRVGHYLAELSITLALGIRVATASTPMDLGMVALGALLAVLVLLNRAVNDMVHAARATSGLPPLALSGAASPPSRPGLARIRSLARYVPVHRAFHSVELTILVFVASIGDLIGPATTGLLVVLVPLAAVTVVGHVVAVVASSRLSAP